MKRSQKQESIWTSSSEGNIRMRSLQMPLTIMKTQQRNLQSSTILQELQDSQRESWSHIVQSDPTSSSDPRYFLDLTTPRVSCQCFQAHICMDLCSSCFMSSAWVPMYTSFHVYRVRRSSCRLLPRSSHMSLLLFLSWLKRSIRARWSLCSKRREWSSLWSFQFSTI